MEAARSLGMTHWQAMRRVVFPQAIKNSLPAIGNEFIINIKDSSVLIVLGVSDLMFMTRSVAGIYYKGTECYLIAATVYLFLTYLSSLLLKTITGRMTAPDNTKRRQGKPMMHTTSPRSTSKLMPLSTWRSPKDFSSCSILMMGSFVIASSCQFELGSPRSTV